jgi:RNA polymerase sigma factor (sigma-70 family)
MSANETSISLLDQLRKDPQQPDWERLVEVYTPVLQAWLRRYDLQQSDADDLVQDVLIVVSRELVHFQHTGHPGAFRAWLRTILVNRLRHHWRSCKYRPVATGDSSFLQHLQQLDDPHSELSQLWNAEHDRHLTWQLMEIVKPQFSETTYEAFRRLALEGQDPSGVAADLGISRNAAIIAKHRVLKALRRAGGGLLGDGSVF